MSDSLKKINQDLANFKTLEIAQNCIQPVMGKGNPKSEIVFIGEAPGAEEDKLGEPFIGRSGKLLNQMLESINLNRESVYITNIVKFRPPKNRDPNPSEKEACLPFLIRELKIIKPKLICTLGRHSMNFFLPKAKISENHGILQTTNLDLLNQINIFPLYHPAAALYNPNQKQTLFEDFQKIPSVINQLNEL
jgi:DNA polymerase